MDILKKIGQFFGITKDEEEEKAPVQKVELPEASKKLMSIGVSKAPVKETPTVIGALSKALDKSLTGQFAKNVPSAVGTMAKDFATSEYEKSKQTSTLPVGEQFKSTFIDRPTNLLTSGLQGLAAGLSSTGQSLLEFVYAPILGKETVRAAFDPQDEIGKKVKEAITGGPQKSWQNIAEDVNTYTQDSPVATPWEKKHLGTVVAMAGFLADVFPSGGKSKIGKEIIEQIAKETDEKVIRELLIKGGAPDILVERSAAKLVGAKTPDEVKNVLMGEQDFMAKEFAPQGPDPEAVKSMAASFDKGDIDAPEVADFLKNQLPDEDPVVIENFASGLEGMRENGQSIEGVVERNFLDVTDGGKTVPPTGEIPSTVSPTRPQQEVQASESIIQPTTDKVKQRGFIESVLESENIPPETKKMVEELPEYQRNYGVFTDATAVKTAREEINRNKDAVLSQVLDTKNPGKQVVTNGLELMRQYREVGNHEMEAKIAGHLAEQATKGGQFIQAFSMLNKLSPDGILVFASKRTGKPVPEPLAKKLVEKAKIIEDLPHGYEKYKETQDLINIISHEIPRSTGKKVYDFLADLVNIPRTIMSSFDLSFGLRQGLVAGARHPKEWAQAFKSQFKAVSSERGYDELMDTIFKHPDFDFARESGVAFSDVNQTLLGREERFMSSMIEKVPGIGTAIRKSNRAYTGMANKLRMDTFSTLSRNAEILGLDPKNNEVIAKQIANLVNDMTGRGSMHKALEGAAPLFNAIFFSPRLISSRLNLLNPVRYATATPYVRKEALKTMLAFGATVTTVLALASQVPGVDVGTDPRSADFGKIKTGNTRVDIAGGFQQYARIAAQVTTGKYVSSSTGRVITLGEGYKPLTRKQVLVRGLESKEAPVFSFLTTLLEGQDIEGNKINVGKEVANRFTPMIVSDMYDLAKENPELLPLGFLSVLGIGTQTYGPPEAYRKVNEIDSSSDPAAAFDKLKKESPILAEKVKKAKIEQSFNEFDWGLTYMGVENGDRAKFLNETFKKLPSDATRAELWNDLKKKKLISDQVDTQIKYLLKSQQ